MYTIKEAAQRSGVSIPLLRAWERRYGIVEPSRTAAGYRLYDDDALDRLRAMRRLVDTGWTPSNAAAAILAGRSTDDKGTAMGAAGTPSGADPSDPRPARDESGDRRADTIDAFVQAAIDLDGGRIERVLDEMFAAGSFEAVTDTQVMPALVALGEAWEDGRLPIAGEHAASHAVLRRLAAAYQAAGRAAPASGVILVGMPPAGRHELGALAFSTAARRAGLPILYLGPDLPISDWVVTAERAGARAAVIGVITRADVRPATEVARALRASHPGLAVLFGGPAARRAAAAIAADPTLPAAAASPGRSAALAPIALPDGVAASIAELEATILRLD